jgi:hypothetical protein
MSLALPAMHVSVATPAGFRRAGYFFFLPFAATFFLLADGDAPVFPVRVAATILWLVCFLPLENAASHPSAYFLLEPTRTIVTAFTSKDLAPH